jgi:hypothetical protein
MAYTFLKALGVDGDIGTISVDLKDGATGSEGHKILSAKAGEVKIESSRYPFCFYGAEKDPNATASVLPFLPFNEELNRYMLVVNNLGAEQAEVSWGPTSKTFTRAQLEAGVNLAAEFLDNPFSKPFQDLDRAVNTKQQFETQMIKGVVTQFRSMRTLMKDDPEVGELLDVLYKKLAGKQEELQETARAVVKPMTHKLSIVAK